MKKSKMPVYEYKRIGKGCDYCSHGFEIYPRIEDEPLTKCPACHSRVERIISSFSIGKGNILSASNLKEHGFSKLRKVGEGKYLKE